MKLKKKAEVDEKLIPVVNIGTLGHVSHGKTTLTEALTGTLTLTHSEELKRGISIRLGYADTTFYKCSNYHYGLSEKCQICFSDCEILRTVSFIDAPGHETLMATVLTGARLMDGVLFVIAANEKCPQPQTREHLIALEVVGLKNVIIVQNKIDLVSEERAVESYGEIKNFIKGSVIENSPIIPVSAQQRVNIDYLIEAIEKYIPTPERDLNKDFRMLIARSFDINRPGTEISRLSGGILGGSIVQGKVSVGERIEIRPGIRVGNNYKSIFTQVVGLKKGGIEVMEASAGGLLGLMTSLDPSLTKSDSLVGNLVGLPDKLPLVKDILNLEITLISRTVGDELKNIQPIRINEDLLVNIGTARTVGTVQSAKRDRVELKLKIPVSAEEKDRVVLSRLINGRWRLIGFGIVS